jgi:hypothetical protein
MEAHEKPEPKTEENAKEAKASGAPRTAKSTRV